MTRCLESRRRWHPVKSGTNAETSTVKIYLDIAQGPWVTLDEITAQRDHISHAQGRDHKLEPSDLPWSHPLHPKFL